MSDKKIIPKKFYKGDLQKPVAFTVGELKAILQELPDELPIQSEFAGGVELVVYNVKAEDAHLAFREPFNE
ncbi:MAG: hypothetical protein Q8L60_05655 [Gammaproteobacteria bacterium]|nr:hypothetical protein [Gammaproteobacteria bacterium]MDP2346857.1 hypothetical protein [Gammaproteobacteria bacterium]